MPAHPPLLLHVPSSLTAEGGFMSDSQSVSQLVPLVLVGHHPELETARLKGPHRVFFLLSLVILAF